MPRSPLLLPLAVFATTWLGCAPSANSPPPSGREARQADKQADRHEAKAPADKDKAAADKDKAPAEEQARKIIYTARVELVVEEFDKAQEALTRLVEENKGYVARSDTRGAPGSPRSGEWTLRVPAEKFPRFVADLANLGELRQSKTDSDDVTEGYYDLKAHILNDQAEEEALRKLMSERTATGKLEDLLAVRRELRELRGKIDSQKGQMERWDKEVAMTTVVVQIQDRKDYVPTTAPTFGTSISRTFEGSIDALLTFGKGIVLVAVALAPWLAVVGIPTLAAWWLLRKRLQSATSRPKVVTPAAPPPASS